MGMEFLGNVLQGFNDSTDSIRKQNQHEADLQTERDNKVFEALANSDDPDIRAAAVTGLLTGTHPARAFDKFLGKVGTHPAYETIKGLVGQGHQAFPGATEGERLGTEAKTSGAMTGLFGGAEQAGVNLTPEQKQKIVMAKAGAAQRSPMLAQGNLLFNDGSESPGYFDPETRTYYDENQSPRYDVKEFRQGKAGGGAGAQDPNAIAWDPHITADTGQFPGEKSAGGWIMGHKKADGTQVHKPAQEPPPPVPSIVQTPTGNVGVGRGGAEVGLPPAARGGRAVSPETNVSALKGAIDEIIRLVPAPQGILGSAQAAQAKVKAGRDKAAASMGYADFATMQQEYGKAVGNVGTYTPGQSQQGAPPGPVNVGGRQKGGDKTAAPGGASPATPPAQVDPNDPAGLFR